MPISYDIEKDYLYKKGLEAGLEKGEDQGEAKKTRQAAVNMVKLGLDTSVICQALEVPEAYVREIRKELGLS